MTNLELKEKALKDFENTYSAVLQEHRRLIKDIESDKAKLLIKKWVERKGTLSVIKKDLGIN